MKKAILCFLLFSPIFCSAQSDYEMFTKYFQKGDTTNARKTIENWTNKSEAEYYTAAFNYRFNNASYMNMFKTDKPIDENSLLLEDSSGKFEGYMNFETLYNTDKFEYAISTLDSGIEKHPKRLDMYFGKIHSIGLQKNYKRFTKEIITVIELSNSVNNNWLWTNNKKLDSPKAFFLNAMQNYMQELYNTMDDSLLHNIKNIGNSLLQFYPKHVPTLSTVGVSNVILKDFDKGLEYLLRAEKAAPKDFIVLNNIAHTYKVKKDKTNAIKYYKRVLDYGDDQAKTLAKQELEKLTKD